MLLKRLQNVHKLQTSFGYTYSRKNISLSSKVHSARPDDKLFGKEEDILSKDLISTMRVSVPNSQTLINPIIPTHVTSASSVVSKDSVILSFDDVPGPKSLKLFASFSQYLSDVGTQILANVITMWLNIGTLLRQRKSLTNLSTLFDMYGPVVRFVSPMGGNIVLLNKPEHIEKVFTMEGEFPVRSQLDSLEKFRQENRNHVLSGLYSIHDGEEWSRRRLALSAPLEAAVSQHAQGMFEVTNTLVNKIFQLRNHQDEMPKDLYREIHKWAFDIMGLIVFSKKFTVLENEVASSQCEMSWLYHTLDNSTKAIMKCESGMQLWKVVATPAWLRLVKHCNNLHDLIGKYVLESEQMIRPDIANMTSLIDTMLSKDKMNVSDITTIIMDMLLLGVNTISSSTSFLLYFLAKHQKVQRKLYMELDTVYPNFAVVDVNKLKTECPYLQACIKETLRLVPPIPLLTRVLNKNIILDNFNIPRGTMLMMSTQISSLKESNYDDASRFCPERWLAPDANEYHAFASIPFGYGARKCLGQNIAETMISLITVKILQKFKLEYHYGDINATKHFIALPNKPLKIRFIDRH